VLRKGEKREKKGSAPSRANGEAMVEASAVQDVDRTPGTVWARPGRNGGRRRDRDWAVAHGSFEDLGREVSRSRRFEHPFVLARVPLTGSGADADRRHERTLALLSSLIRTVDRMWLDGKDVYLLFPESDRVKGGKALVRLREPLSEVLSEQELDGITFAVFAPDECLTSGALLSALRGRVSDARERGAGSHETAGRAVPGPEGAGS
jgi:hypothetical protein